MRSFIHMGKLQEYLNDHQRKLGQAERRQEEKKRQIHPDAEDDPSWINKDNKK